MIRDLYRVWGLWRARGGWLLIGVAVAVASALSAVALLALAGQGVAQGVALGGGALAILLLRPLMVARPALRWAERMASHAPLRRLGDDEDLKGLTLLYASEAGKHITGQWLAVDGGVSAIIGG
jgi:enoyl-[acyl-carrier-protein] reductase (NADH)